MKLTLKVLHVPSLFDEGQSSASSWIKDMLLSAYLAFKMGKDVRIQGKVAFGECLTLLFLLPHVCTLSVIALTNEWVGICTKI